MSSVKIVCGILLFALVTAVLYVWGLKKSVTQAQDLERVLLSKSAGKVVKYLKKNGTIDLKEMARQVEGVRAGEFWSRKKAVVQDPGRFARQLAQFMVEQQLVEETCDHRYRFKP